VGDAQREIDLDARDAFAQGLVGLESQFEGLRQQGLANAINAFGGVAQENLAGQGLNLQSLTQQNELAARQNQLANTLGQSNLEFLQGLQQQGLIEQSQQKQGLLELLAKLTSAEEIAKFGGKVSIGLAGL
jgi:hypothetical protein